MLIFQIDYDLHAPEKNYDAVIKAVKSFGFWCHPLKSCWLVAGTDLNIDQVNSVMLGAIDKDDRLLITQFRDPIRGWVDDKINEWISTTIAR